MSSRSFARAAKSCSMRRPVRLCNCCSWVQFVFRKLHFIEWLSLFSTFASEDIKGVYCKSSCTISWRTACKSRHRWSRPRTPRPGAPCSWPSCTPPSRRRRRASRPDSGSPPCSAPRGRATTAGRRGWPSLPRTRSNKVGITKDNYCETSIFIEYLSWVLRNTS